MDTTSHAPGTGRRGTFNLPEGFVKCIVKDNLYSDEYILRRDHMADAVNRNAFGGNSREAKS